jgi:hypothetical protein
MLTIRGRSAAVAGLVAAEQSTALRRPGSDTTTTTIYIDTSPRPMVATLTT